MLTCQAGLTDCNGTCTNTDFDPSNCGGCDDGAGSNTCLSTEYCTGGACTSLGSPCIGNPQWMPVDCTTTRYVWSSDRTYLTIQAANDNETLYTGCSHAGIATTCSLDGLGYVSTATYTMAGCNATWYHIGGDYTGNCGGHDGDQVRRLVLTENDCYAY